MDAGQRARSVAPVARGRQPTAGALLLLAAFRRSRTLPHRRVERCEQLLRRLRAVALVEPLFELRARRQAMVECGLLAVLAFYSAIKVVTPSLLVGWP